MKETVVLVHGIWMIGIELSLLRRRLEACGFHCEQFRYHSLLYTPGQNAARLSRFADGIDAEIVHFVAHSLGGIVVLHLFERDPEQRPGRVLMMGTPLRGSATAGSYHRNPMTRLLLGRSIRRGLLGGIPEWCGAREVGMIAGSRGLGVGSLIPGALERPNDGTVALYETRVPWLNRHLTVPHGHLGMLLSPDVSESVCRFLRDGEFD